MSTISKRFPRPSPEILEPAPANTYHTCLECPACGSEECRTLQELGMYCATAIAASEAMRRRSGTRGGSGVRSRRGLVAVPA